jgi:hypothetical protein
VLYFPSCCWKCVAARMLSDKVSGASCSLPGTHPTQTTRSCLNTTSDQHRHRLSRGTYLAVTGDVDLAPLRPIVGHLYIFSRQRNRHSYTVEHATHHLANIEFTVIPPRRPFVDIDGAAHAYRAQAAPCQSLGISPLRPALTVRCHLLRVNPRGADFIMHR